MLYSPMVQQLDQNPMTILRRKALIIAIVLIGAVSGYAQKSAVERSRIRLYELGVDLYAKAHYAAAQKHFERYLADKEEKSPYHIANAEFYRAMCAINLNNGDAEYLIGEFINHFPESPNIDRALFAMGKVQYQHKKYTQTIYWLKQVTHSGVNQADRYELMFMLGYSYFRCNDLDQAKKWLYRVKDNANKFSGPATYYYAHIAYIQKNYATALKGFNKLKTDKTFAPIVPYYIAQILYLQGSYAEVIQIAPPLIREGRTKRVPELARITGDAYFRLHKFDSSLTYLNRYLESKPTLSRADLYTIGMANYKTGHYAEAARYLERVPTADDSLGQNANYHLADCYLKLDKKKQARQAFGLAAKADFDPIIKEDALFNFAKLTYEQLYAPFNEAINAFKKYIKLYPNSSRTDEAYHYLTLAYLSTKNYRNAIESLEKIKDKDATIKTALQKAAFFRGLELFQNIRYKEAVGMFEKSLRYAEYNPRLAALASYWKAESHYRTSEFNKAFGSYKEFILSPGAYGLDLYTTAHYNLGYAAFKLNRYDEAIVWFRKFINLSTDKSSRFIGDAYNRIGDSFFIQRRYWAAIDYYQKAFETGTIDADYALFQKGFSLGLVNRPKKKITALELFREHFPDSPYMDDALYEIAQCYIALNRPEKARHFFRLVETNYPGSSYYIKVLVQMGLLYYNAEKEDSALIYYKRAVESFPNSPEAKNALLGIRNIYLDRGDADTYFSYASKLGSMASISASERDSLSYMAAEKIFVSGNYTKALEVLNGYLNNFPNGNFKINANFYLGECFSKLNNPDSALAHYKQVADASRNTFTEQSLLKLARIYFGRKDYEQSYKAYTKLEELAEYRSLLLEARMGRLRSAYALELYSDIPSITASILATDKLPRELEFETRYKLTKALIALNRTDEALIELARLSTNVKTTEGAEAKYLMAKIYFEQNQLKRAESEVFSFAEKNTPHQYWLAKSFILLGKVYAKQNDFFQAKATLQSVIDGYTDTSDGIVEEAMTLMQELVIREKKSQSEEGDTAADKRWSF